MNALRVMTQCAGKDRLTWAIANTLAKQSRRRRNKPPIQAYKCDVCGHWHIGQRKPK